MSKKIALLIGASSIGVAGFCRLGINGRVREFPRGEEIAVDEAAYEALKNSNENITLLDKPAADLNEGSPVVAGETQGDGEDDGRPDLIEKDADETEGESPATDPAEDPEQDGRPDLVVSDVADAKGDGGVAIYTGDVPEDLIRWQVADKETGKKAGAAVTVADLRIIAAREGVTVEGDDNKASLQAKIAAARAAAA